jgi:hypothetical protein
VIVEQSDNPGTRPVTMGLDQSPARSVTFSDSQRLLVKEVLTGIRKSGYSAEYLERKVNDELEKHFEDDLGRAVARLNNAFDFAEDDVAVEGPGIRLPGGRYWLEFKAEDAKAGVLTRQATFSETWFSDPARIAGVLKALELTPAEMKCEMTAPIDLKGVVPGLKAVGWTLTSQLPHKVEFTQGPFQLSVEGDAVSFRGLSAAEMLGSAGSKQSKMARSVLLLLGDERSRG